MKKNEILIGVYNVETENVVNQIDNIVPDIFNTYEVCDLCEEKIDCTNCIVNTLQLDTYIN